MSCVGWMSWVAHAIWEWLKSGDWKPSFDGIAAIVVGVIGFVAIIRQTRSSERSVSAELGAEKKIREDEHSSQRRAMASALSAEIDNFYMYHLIDRSRLFESWEKIKADPNLSEVFRVVVGEPFAVYRGLADRLGDFGQGIAKGIIACYSALAAYTELQRWYEQAQTQRYERAMKTTEQREAAEREVSELQLQIKQTAEQAIQLALIICKCLTQLAGTEFSSLLVAKESCAHTETVSELVVRCNSCSQVISRSKKDAQTH